MKISHFFWIVICLLVSGQASEASIVSIECKVESSAGSQQITYVFDTEKRQVQTQYPPDKSILSNQGRIVGATITDTALTVHTTRPSEEPFFDIAISRLTGEGDYTIPNKDPLKVHLKCEPSNVKSFVSPILSFNSAGAMPLECRDFKPPTRENPTPTQGPFLRRPTLFLASKQLTCSSPDGATTTVGGRIIDIKPDRISLALEGVSGGPVILNVMNGTFISYAQNLGVWRFEECRMTSGNVQRKF